MIGRGNGTALVRLHCKRLFAAGAPAIGTDPHPIMGAPSVPMRKRAHRRGRAGDTLWAAPLMERCDKVLSSVGLHLIPVRTRRKRV